MRTAGTAPSASSMRPGRSVVKVNSDDVNQSNKEYMLGCLERAQARWAPTGTKLVLASPVASWHETLSPVASAPTLSPRHLPSPRAVIRLRRPVRRSPPISVEFSGSTVIGVSASGGGGRHPARATRIDGMGFHARCGKRGEGRTASPPEWAEDTGRGPPSLSQLSPPTSPAGVNGPMPRRRRDRSGCRQLRSPLQYAVPSGLRSTPSPC